MKYEIGERIKRYRIIKGMSQKELAQRLGVSVSRVSNWESGLNRPDVDIFAEICNVLDVKPNLILGIGQHTISDEEMQIIECYRNKPEMHHAIKVLLGIE